MKTFSVPAYPLHTGAVMVDTMPADGECPERPGCTTIGKVDIQGVLYCMYFCPDPTPHYVFVRCD